MLFRSLTRKGLVAKSQPTVIEIAFVLINPLLRRVMRSMGRAGRVVYEEWLLGRHRLLELDPFDRLSRQVGCGYPPGIQ